MFWTFFVGRISRSASDRGAPVSWQDLKGCTNKRSCFARTNNSQTKAKNKSTLNKMMKLKILCSDVEGIVRVVVLNRSLLRAIAWDIDKDA